MASQDQTLRAGNGLLWLARTVLTELLLKLMDFPGDSLRSRTLRGPLNVCTSSKHVASAPAAQEASDQHVQPLLHLRHLNTRAKGKVLRRVHSEGVGEVVSGGAAGHGGGQPARHQRRQLRAAARRQHHQQPHRAARHGALHHRHGKNREKQKYLPEAGGEDAGDEEARHAARVAELPHHVQWQQPVRRVDHPRLRIG
ncbi:hypothetical protein MSG28_003443 [Choristoneura fumiferana]|uniref:Uncharacterized protein n=1 Tax=Choristoneura fumiferana TaxID=7141 RepID=A0ACC0KFJ5_CHOFU|nr:hypothetical protein MSG28_003443 [Choristoneura fumiferana]